MPRVTLQTIADRVGVSRMTVSNAFSRPDQLSAPLRARILAAAQELGYVGPDPAARALARGTTGAVGILLTDSLRYAFSDEVAADFLGAVTDELAPFGFALTLLPSAESGDIVPARDVAMDGALVYSCDPAAPAVDWLRKRRLPLVYVDQDPVDDASSVNVDDRSGARQAAQHLVELGHRRVGLMLAGKRGPVGELDDAVELLDGHPSRQRLLGWLDALQPAGIRPLRVRQRFSGVEDTLASARLMLDRPDRPTAVLCFADTMAYGLVQVAEELGISVPEQLSVVGFDDHPLAGCFHPPLTTVRQDVSAKGQAAAAALTTAIRHSREGSPAPATRVLLPTELVIRDSTAPPPP